MANTRSRSIDRCDSIASVDRGGEADRASSNAISFFLVGLSTLPVVWALKGRFREAGFIGRLPQSVPSFGWLRLCSYIPIFLYQKTWSQRGIRPGRASVDRSKAARASATAHTARGHAGCVAARSRSNTDTCHGRWCAMQCVRLGRASVAQFQTAVVAQAGRPGTGFGAADARCIGGRAGVAA